MNLLVGKSSDKSWLHFFPPASLSMPHWKRTPVKNLLRWKMLQSYDIFFLFSGKNTKKVFLLPPSDFFLVNREMWQMVVLLFQSQDSWKMTCNVFEISKKWETSKQFLFFLFSRKLVNLNGKIIFNHRKTIFQSNPRKTRQRVK